MSIKQRFNTLFGGPAVEAGTSFMPADYLTRKAEMRANVVCLVLFSVVLFGVIGAFLVTHRAWNAVRDQQRTVNAEYTEQTRKIEQLKQLDAQQALMLAKAEIAASLNERVPRSILLAELVNRMPDRLTLIEMQLVGKRVVEAPPPKTSPSAPQSLTKSVASKGGKTPGGMAPETPRPKPPRMDFVITITGFASSDEAVADFQAALKQCDLLTSVDLVSAEATAVGDLTIRKFRIEAAIREGADARRIEPLQIPRIKSAMAGLPGSGASPGAGGSAGPASGPPSTDPNFPNR